MKNTIYLTLFSLIFTSLSAFSSGKEGAPYEKDGIMWQNVYMVQDGLYSVQGSLPGVFKGSVFQSNQVFLYSDFNKTQYNIWTFFQQPVENPKNVKEGIKLFKEILGKDLSLKQIPCEQKAVLFVLEAWDKKESSLIRFYATKGQMIFAVILGKDFSAQEPFFDSLKFQ